VKNYDKDAMQISERELNALTADMDELHYATLPDMREELAEWAETNDMHSGIGRVTGAMSTRRTFLLGTGATMGGLVLAACGSSKKKSESSTTEAGSGGSSKGGPLTGDAQFIAMSASLENLAVGTYQAAIDAVTANKLTGVPPAVVTFAMTAQKQHRDHADAFNQIVKAAGHAAVTTPDMVDGAFAKVASVADLAKLARLLENTAAATYQDGVSKVSGKESIKVLASIQPVERQHAAILSYVLGEYPVPDVFAKTDKPGEEARPASDFTG